MEASTSSTIEPESMYNYMNGLLMNPSAFIILVLVVLVYIIIFVSLGDSSSSPNSYIAMPGTSGLDKTSGIIMAIVIGVFVILLLFKFISFNRTKL